MARPRVLVLEDDSRLGEVLVESLHAEGFDASAFARGRELLDRAARSPADAFVIDVSLPDADGRDVCQALRANGFSAPVLFLTGRDSRADRAASDVRYSRRPLRMASATAAARSDTPSSR
jgi:DNA-binding response OmpR family regulator